MRGRRHVTESRGRRDVRKSLPKNTTKAAFRSWKKGFSLKLLEGMQTCQHFEFRCLTSESNSVLFWVPGTLCYSSLRKHTPDVSCQTEGQLPPRRRGNALDGQWSQVCSDPLGDPPSEHREARWEKRWDKDQGACNHHVTSSGHGPGIILQGRSQQWLGTVGPAEAGLEGKEGRPASGLSALHRRIASPLWEIHPPCHCLLSLPHFPGPPSSRGSPCHSLQAGRQNRW